MELNTISRGRKHLANVQEKWTYNTGLIPSSLKVNHVVKYREISFFELEILPVPPQL